MEAGAEAAHGAQVKRQEVKEERAVRFGGQGDHLAFLLVDRSIVNMLQVRGFAAQTGAVIHDLAVNLASGKVYKAQDSPSILGRANRTLAFRTTMLLKDFFIS